MYFCIRGIDFASEIFLLDFETVPTLIVFVFQLIVIFISWLSVLLVHETAIPGENHCPTIID
jgi:hypothetical protein